MKRIKILFIFLLNIIGASFNIEAAIMGDESNRIADVGVELYGTLIFSNGWETGVTKYDSAGIYSFCFENNYQAKPIIVPGDLASGGSVYGNGKIYMNTFEDESNLGKRKPIWKIIDPTTWKIEKEIELADNFYGITLTMAYDPVSKKIYAYALKNYMEAEFAIIDPETALIRRIAPLGQRLYGMACNKEGVLYGLTASYELVKINKATGEFTSVCGVVSQGKNNYNYKQGLTFNQATGKLYWMTYQNDNDGNDRTFLQEINLTDGSTKWIGMLPKGAFISGIFLLEPNGKAPKAAPKFKYIADEEGAETGKFEFTTPGTTYYGEPLDEKLTAVIYENGNMVETLDNLEPNTTYVSSNHTFKTNKHTVEIEMINAIGKSSRRAISFYSGWDVPKAPTNIILTRDDLKSIVTWEAPTEGNTGGAINPDLINYKVQLYPGEITVAEELKECKFTYQHGEDMTRYIYRITSYTNNRIGGNALSNNLIIGTPLNPPYDGSFPTIYSMMNYFTILDLNKDWATWYYDANTHAAYYMYNMYSPADDWLISPAFKMKAGYTYQLSFVAWSSLPPYLESLKVTFGNSIKPEEQSTVLLDFPELSGDQNQYTTNIVVDEDGIYHFGFQAYSSKFREFLYVQDIYLDGGTLTNKINSTQKDNIKITTEKSKIIIQNPDNNDLSIINIQGVICTKSSDSEIIKYLPSGIYIIKGVHFNQRISIP